MNPWLIIGVGIAWLASLVSVGQWQNSIGHVQERTKWQAKENAELKEKAATIERLTKQVREMEDSHTAAMVKIGNNFTEELRNAEEYRRRDVARARAGNSGLRIAAPVCPNGGGGPEGPPLPASPGGDGARTIELPSEVAGRLFELAHDANAIATRLTACQKIIIEDRRVCNG